LLTSRSQRSPPSAAREAASAGHAAPYLVLLAIGLAVTVFRGAYEQVGNTVALWADSGVDRALGYGLKYPTGFKDTHLQRV